MFHFKLIGSDEVVILNPQHDDALIYIQHTHVYHLFIRFLADHGCRVTVIISRILAHMIQS